MIKLNIHEAKVQFSRCIAEVEAGETIIACRGNEPVAEIRPLPPTSHEPRPFGLLKGQFEVPESFFEPLPEDVVAGFEGRETTRSNSWTPAPSFGRSPAPRRFRPV